MTVHSERAPRALAHLGEVDPALAVLALWCRHRDTDGETRTDGGVIRYGPGFDHLSLPEQVGLAAHHVLHVALRHGDRQAGLRERLGDHFDPTLYGLAADSIINETLLLAGHGLPRPAVTLTDLLEAVGLPARSAVEALGAWDADRLAMALHADPDRARKARDYAARRAFVDDLRPGEAAEEGADDPSAADWRNQILMAMETGRKAGIGIGKLGGLLADLTPASVPWEVHLRGLLARALTERPRASYRRPSGRWLALTETARREGGPAPVFEPGRQRMDTRPRIVIGLDTSSSIDPQTLRLFTAEAEAIARRTGAEAHLLAFDEEVFAEIRLDPGDWGRLRNPDLRTGGGTDFRDLFARADHLSPSVAIILTDLDADLPDRPQFPLIWAVPGRVARPRYGHVVEIGAL